MENVNRLNNISYIKGDIFNSQCDCLVNPVNTVGVSGRGLALEFKKRYPSMFELYKSQCQSGKFKIGLVLFYKLKTGDKKTICVFPTKEHWRHPSNRSYIEGGLKAFINYYQSLEIKSVAFPKLGCGLGGLNWEYEVRPLMEKYLGSCADLRVEIYI